VVFLQARRTGGAVETSQKGKLEHTLDGVWALTSHACPLTAANAGTNKVGSGQQTTSGKPAYKLDEETEDFHRKLLHLCVSQTAHN
jgi:hypothetical protein